MNAPQGSEAWMLERCGLPTASQYSSVLAKGQGLTRKKYLRRIVAEILTGKPIADSSYGAWQQNLERGHEQEEAARSSYEAITGELVEQVGFIRHPTIRTGCSPDGLIGTDGGCEIKSVIPTVQIETILAGGYPSEHRAQIQGNLWNVGEMDKADGREPRQWWDFVSNSPDMPEHLRLYIFRVAREETYIETLAAEVVVFLAEVDELVAKLNGGKK